jgi:hypothetical protein
MNAMPTNNDVIANWQPHHETLFGRHTIKLNHTLPETDMFTREAIPRLIERCSVEELSLVSRIYGEDGSRRAPSVNWAMLLVWRRSTPSSVARSG